MTAPRCSICARPDRDAIDEELKRGRTLRALAKKFGTTDSTLDRHKQHIGASASVRHAAGASHASACAPLVEPMKTSELVTKLEAIVQQQVLRLATEEDLSEIERSKMQTSAMTTLSHLAKLQGRTELSERRILESPALRRIQQAMIAALTPWPEALRAVGEALQNLGAEQGA